MRKPALAPKNGLAEPAHVEATLPNGLEVVLVPRDNLHRAVASLFLRVGSRYEQAESNGISHFLEHMVFRGTPSMPSAHAQALAFERLGGTLYAATHIDHGVMSVGVPPENFRAVLPLLGEVATSPRFTEIEVERGIVHEEILEDLDDDGRLIDADSLARALVYDDHPLGFTITGSLENLRRLDRPMLEGHHARHYTTQNAVLCLAGKLGDLDELVEIAARAFESMPAGDRVPISPPASPIRDRARFSFVENQSSQTDLRLTFRAPSEHDPREAAAEMLLRVLDDGMSTRLYERVCDRRGLCYDVSAAFETYEDDGLLDIAAGVQHDRAAKVASEIVAVLSELASHGPTDEEVKKAKDRHRWSIEAMLDDAEELASFFGVASIARISRSPLARHEELAAVTKEAIRDVAAEIFSQARLGGVAVGLLSAAEERRVERIVREL